MLNIHRFANSVFDWRIFAILCACCFRFCKRLACNVQAAIMSFVLFVLILGFRSVPYDCVAHHHHLNFSQWRQFFYSLGTTRLSLYNDQFLSRGIEMWRLLHIFQNSFGMDFAMYTTALVLKHWAPRPWFMLFFGWRIAQHGELGRPRIRGESTSHGFVPSMQDLARSWVRQVSGLSIGEWAGFGFSVFASNEIVAIQRNQHGNQKCWLGVLLVIS